MLMGLGVVYGQLLHFVGGTCDGMICSLFYFWILLTRLV